MSIGLIYSTDLLKVSFIDFVKILVKRKPVFKIVPTKIALFSKTQQPWRY